MAEPPRPDRTVRQDVEITSRGTVCRGWLTYPPDAAQHAVPLVLMAHGFGATRDMLLEPYARRFNAAGLATLIFDYRGFGASDGEPRNVLSPPGEVADWHAALAYARTLPGIDPDRIALWGTSFAGGLVVIVAAEDGRIAATVSQCPLLDGRAAVLEIARYAGMGALLRLSVHAVLDLARAALGATPHRIPIVARPGEVGAMTSADAYDGYMRLTPPGFRNDVAARVVLAVPLFRPIRHARRVTCPALLQLCEHDTVAPVRAAEKAAARMPASEVVRYPVGHFDVYTGDAFERSVSDQVAFLTRHLEPGGTSRQSSFERCP